MSSSEIVNLLKAAQKIASEKYGVSNILQPGIIKELIMAEILEHEILRNKAFYFGIFKNHLEIDELWRVEIPVVLFEVKRQLQNCKNDIAHVNFLLKWLEENGTKVFPKNPPI